MCVTGRVYKSDTDDLPSNWQNWRSQPYIRIFLSLLCLDDNLNEKFYSTIQSSLLPHSLSSMNIGQSWRTHSTMACTVITCVCVCVQKIIHACRGTYSVSVWSRCRYESIRESRCMHLSLSFLSSSFFPLYSSFSSSYFSFSSSSSPISFYYFSLPFSPSCLSSSSSPTLSPSLFLSFHLLFLSCLLLTLSILATSSGENSYFVWQKFLHGNSATHIDFASPLSSPFQRPGPGLEVKTWNSGAKGKKVWPSISTALTNVPLNKWAYPRV